MKSKRKTMIIRQLIGEALKGLIQKKNKGREQQNCKRKRKLQELTISQINISPVFEIKKIKMKQKRKRLQPNKNTAKKQNRKQYSRQRPFELNQSKKDSERPKNQEDQSRIVSKERNEHQGKQ